MSLFVFLLNITSSKQPCINIIDKVKQISAT